MRLHDQAANSAIDKRQRNKLLYRASYRGTAEMDFLLGSFAKTWLETCDDEMLAAFSQLLKIPDPELEPLILGKTPLPPTGILNRLIPLIQSFHDIKPSKIKQAPLH